VREPEADWTPRDLYDALLERLLALNLERTGAS
jgi:hypothetical protein